MSGTVNISRDLWDDPAFRDAPFTEREAWVWMICEASWKARERRVDNFVVDLDRGEFAASVRHLGEVWGWSKSTVHRFLDRLKNRDMIATESGTGLLIVSICNYDKYQGERDEAGTARRRRVGQQRDSSGTIQKKGGRKGRISTAAGVVPDLPREAPAAPVEAAAGASPVMEDPPPLPASTPTAPVAAENGQSELPPAPETPKRKVERGTLPPDPTQADPTPMERAWRAAGLPALGPWHDQRHRPCSGDSGTLERWIERDKLTLDQICEVIAITVAKSPSRRQNPDWIPGTLGYFDDAMADFVRARDKPMPQGTVVPFKGGPRQETGDEQRARWQRRLAELQAEEDAERAAAEARRAAKND